MVESVKDYTIFETESIAEYSVKSSMCGIEGHRPSGLKISDRSMRRAGKMISSQGQLQAPDEEDTSGDEIIRKSDEDYSMNTYQLDVDKSQVSAKIVNRD